MSHGAPGAVVHRHVTLIACDGTSTLNDTIKHLEDLDADLVRIGDHYLAVPAHQVNLVLSRMREHGQFPRLLGEIADFNTEDEEEELEA